MFDAKNSQFVKSSEDATRERRNDSGMEGG
jgi:hypothetical protein